MKSNVLFILTIIICTEATAQQEAGFEQYYYVQAKEPVVMMPIAHYQSKTNWYTEARYNYEDLNTFSLYAGKIFTRDRKISYSIIPILGAVMGKFKGGSAGLNLNIEYKEWYLSAQSQYTVSANDKTSTFFYSWSELGYEFSDFIYAGLAIQETSLYAAKPVCETGVVVGLSFGKWVFPIYAFSPFDNSRYFIIGINRTLKK